MTHHAACNASPEKGALEDLRELKSLVANLPDHAGDVEFQTQVFELVDQLQDLCLHTHYGSALRKLVAHFGDAYFFFNKTGDPCLLTDFLHDAKRAETLISSK